MSRFSRPLAALCVGFSLAMLVACGASPPPPPEAPPAAVDAGPPEDAAPPTATSEARTQVGCKSRPTVCAEYQGLTAEEAAKLREQCAGEGGQALDACPTERVAGACTATRGVVTVRQIVYRAKTSKETRHLVNAAKEACDKGHGVFAGR